MRGTAFICLILFSLLTAQANATAIRAVYQGELEGAGSVVMELQAGANPGEWNGRYFYPQQGIDIPLSGTADALREPIALTELGDEQRNTRDDSTDAAFEHPAALWSGRISETRFVGRWTDQRSKRVRRFDLKRVANYDPEAIQADAVETISESIAGGVSTSVAGNVLIDMQQAPYEFLKLQDRSKPVGEEIGSDTLAYRYWQDPRTQLKYPRISRHPDAKAMQTINALLEQRHWQLSLAALDCAATRYTDNGPAAGSLGNYDEETISVHFFTVAVLSISESGSTYCSGAHPHNHYDPITFDLRRGEYLDWNRVLRAFERSEYNGRQPSKVLVDFIEAQRENPAYLVNQSIDGAPDDSSCAEVLPQYLALSFTAPDKLTFNVSGIGHAMGVCLGPQLEVPFNKLKSLLAPNGKAYLLQDKLTKNSAMTK